MQLQITIKITGQVQGVFFRQSTKDQADALGITGWVKNEPDGSVMTSIEGEQAQLDALLAWAQHGPANAGAAAVQVISQKHCTNPCETFTILYD